MLISEFAAKIRPSIFGFALFLISVAAMGCAGGSKQTDNQSRQQAFLRTMAYHHETTLQIAEIAQKNGQTKFVRKLATSIKKTQRNELHQMRTIYDRLYKGEIRPDAGSNVALGLTGVEAGMAHSVQFRQELLYAKPFDREFVDQMVPQDLGAINMANAVLEEASDRQLRSLATTIVSLRSLEVGKMDTFRTEQFGSPAPRPRSPHPQGEDGHQMD